MNVFKYFPYGILLAVLLWGCASPQKDPAKLAKEKKEAENRRKDWFKNAAGKPISRQRSIETEVLTEEPAALPRSEKKENPYPIYKGAEESEKDPAQMELPRKVANGETVAVELNFNNSAIADVIPVFAEQLKFNYLLDGKLNGTLTLVLKEKMTQEQLWNLLEQVLRASNIFYEEKDGLVYFRPMEAVTQASLEESTLTTAEVKIFHLNNIGAKETAAQLGPFLSPGLKPLVLEERNLLVVADSRRNLQKLRRIVAELDQPLRKGWAKMVIPCRNIDAARLAKEAAELLPVLGFPTALNSDKPRPEEVQLTSVDRLQIIVASAASYEALEELGRWINILDQSESGDQERIFIYNILNGNAEELVKALAVMFPVEGETLTTSTSSSSSTSGSGELFSSSSTTTSTSRTTTQSGSVKSTSGTRSKDEGAANIFEVPVKIFADAVNNRLIIRTRPRTYTMIKALLGKIDTIPPQVLFQVLVIDVSLNDSVKFGVEFMMKGGSGNVTSQGGTNFSGLNPGSGQNAQSGGQFWIYNPKNPDQKYGYINALAGKTNVKVISSPQVLIASNNEAKISVGSKVPIVNSEITNTQSIISSSTDASTNLVRNIQYQDTGVILKITPRVTRGGRIAIKLAQTVSEADSNTVSDIDSPVIKEQIIETAMSLRDGQTLICGGIIKEKSSDNLSTLPGIGGIPFLRRLLGDTDISTDRTEMMILITGYIINENTQLEELIRRYEQAVDALIDFHSPAEVRKRKMDRNQGVVETWFIE